MLIFSILGNFFLKKKYHFEEGSRYSRIKITVFTYFNYGFCVRLKFFSYF